MFAESISNIERSAREVIEIPPCSIRSFDRISGKVNHPSPRLWTGPAEHGSEQPGARTIVLKVHSAPLDPRNYPPEFGELRPAPKSLQERNLERSLLKEGAFRGGGTILHTPTQTLARTINSTPTHLG